MSLRSSKSSWGSVTVIVHWLMVLVIMGMFALGLWMTSLSYYDIWYKQGPYIHKSVGLILFSLLLFRLFWRWLNTLPLPLVSHAKWEQKLAHLVHMVLYVLLIGIMLSGYLISTADGRSIEVFNWFQIPALPLSIDQQEDTAGAAHFYLAVVLMGSVGLHALGALKHHFIDKDETLRRMLRLN